MMAVQPARTKPLAILPPDARPEIRLGPDIHRMTSQAIAALSEDEWTMQRAGQLVHVTGGAVPTIRPMTRSTLRERLSRCARWVQRVYRDGEEKFREVIPPDTVTGAVLDRGTWRGIRPIVGIVTTPTLRRDGSLLCSPGWDAATGYVYLPSARFPPIPEAPSQADAADALAQLALVFQDFPFATPAARLVPIAALCTILARPAIDGAVPAFLLDATTMASGKTLAATVVSEIALGRDAARATWPEEEEELEKIIGAYALRGASLIVFDNLTKPFCGGPLDRVLTARDVIESRVLGRSDIPTLPWRAVVLATGNNLDVRGDTIRRVLVGRLEPGIEHPELRTDFHEPDLLGYVQRSRERLVAAALTMLRAYVVAGRPDMHVRSWGSFESWAHFIPSAIAFAGGVDVSDARLSGNAGRDADVLAIALIMRALPTLDPTDQGVSVRELVDLLYPGGRPPGRDAPPDGYAPLRDALEQLAPPRSGYGPAAASLSYRLRGARGRVIDGRCLERTLDRAGVARWRSQMPATKDESPAPVEGSGSHLTGEG